ncbi:RDD family protein [Cellulomonas fimi]|uniref:RDD domain containing protein n=1 Tax=Cellulomonas fimi (strain ATCC 484 / DSM 20113 / JCM 1341 / CCUG 24087 / LMG 16345 / NBRC 15513 / NCIMB 8980 / NCTC 7547 / NRS-133) TaxID=590998 RepID=F4H4D1_CELFA|nr:RDD family protein [Cellulomonas fimi]AEE46607.1 RDD domain containing protein [Cellulomonas fimi ATCC 484]NNH08852.1 RDD family protein [Cellulomonas fimi]VEH33652.1 RDD family [Cellulomonas fimi]
MATDEIVIGEGVLLDSRAASAASRLLAALLDLLVLGAVLTGLGILLAVVGPAAGTPTSEEAFRIGWVVTLATITVIYPTVLDTLTRGRSLGKLAVGIRVVRDDGGPIVLRQALVRALVGVVELWLTAGSVALICSMVHPRGKRVGDILAGTYAVRVRGGAQQRRPVEMPPWLAGWAQSADVARLPDGLALSVRQFLTRAPRLHPASRVELGSRLSAEVAQHVHPAPPPGTHPEAFLAAVLAERRTRELAAQLRQDARDAADARQLHRLPHGVPDPD